MTATVSARAATILDRFPSALEVGDPEGTFAFVVDRLAGELDLAGSASGRIRRDHRLGGATDEWALLALVALHGFGPSLFEPLQRRLSAVAAAGAALVAAPEDAALVDTTRAALLDLVSLPSDVVPPLETDDGPEDPARTAGRLADALVAAARYAPEMALRRQVATTAIDVHAEGNATVEALLRATAAMLGLEMNEQRRSDDGYWHFALCSDRLRLTHPATADVAATVLTPIEELVAVEENPFQAADVQPSPKWSTQEFAVTRAGWEEVPVTVVVRGIDDRCMHPMVVNVDTGDGVTFLGHVPDGGELRVERTGQALLDGADVSASCWSFHGAVFATDPAHERAFVWGDADDLTGGGDRLAHFVTTAPATDGFARDAVIPHGGGTLHPPTLLPDTTRWRFFVREGHFGRLVTPDTGAPVAEIASATYAAGVFDESVFDGRHNGQRQPAADVGLEWEEREAFALDVWLPRRFQILDDEGLTPIREQVRILLDRYRAAGVHVRVDYADDRWTLGAGVIRDADTDEPVGTIVAGTTTFPVPT